MARSYGCAGVLILQHVVGDPPPTLSTTEQSQQQREH